MTEPQASPTRPCYRCRGRGTIMVLGQGGEAEHDDCRACDGKGWIAIHEEEP